MQSSLDITHYKQGERVRGFLLIGQNPLSETKGISQRSLSSWLLSLEFKNYLEKLIPSPEI